jgi:hypothetical protein
MTFGKQSICMCKTRSQGTPGKAGQRTELANILMAEVILMPVIQDKLWKHPGNPGMIVVTSHARLMDDGRLFLGYGDAAEAIKRIPDIEYYCGEQIQAVAREGVYGFLPVMPSQPDRRLVGFGLFQSQYSWEDQAIAI